MARQNRLRHGAHAHRVGAKQGGHADLGRRLELWAHEPGVHALVERQPLPDGDRLRVRAQAGVVGIDHVDEAFRAGFAHQRRALRQIEVIAEQHHAAGRQVRLEAARRIGLHQQLATQRLHGAQRDLHAVDGAVLVAVLATAEHRHRGGTDMTQPQLAAVAGDGGLRKTGQFRIGDANRRLYVLRQRAPTRAQQHRHSGSGLRRARANPLQRGVVAHRGCR